MAHYPLDVYSKHGGHLSGNASQHLFLATIVLDPLIVRSHAGEQTLVDPGLFALNGGGPHSHEIQHVLHWV
jgi:hypothetical protein